MMKLVIIGMTLFIASSVNAVAQDQQYLNEWEYGRMAYCLALTEDRVKNGTLEKLDRLTFCYLFAVNHQYDLEEIVTAWNNKTIYTLSAYIEDAERLREQYEKHEKGHSC